MKSQAKYLRIQAMREAEKITKREIILSLIRKFFKEKGFTEVETPLLVSRPDPSPFNEVFETQILKNKKGFLAPSPEFFMKKLVAEGMEKIFQICKAFRNPEELDPLHNPEFTILEWYRTKADYRDLMIDCENLLNFLQQNLSDKKNSSLPENHLKYLGQTINLNPPWPKISLKKAFKKSAQIDLDEFLVLKRAREIARKKGYQSVGRFTWEQLYHQIFLNEIEPKFPKEKPIILYDYPAPLAALARLKKSSPGYAERFELYCGGLELANGYSELTDGKEQEKRLEKDLRIRKKLKMKNFGYDREFLKAVNRMPATAGIAVGVDRLIMLFTNAKTIEEVIPFPVKRIFSS